MRIDPTTLTALSEPRERQAAPSARPGSPSSVVSLGAAASAAQEAAGAETADPSVTTRIARIRAELDGGTYVVDLERLSERILEDDLLREGR